MGVVAGHLSAFFVALKHGIPSASRRSISSAIPFDEEMTVVVYTHLSNVFVVLSNSIQCAASGKPLRKVSYDVNRAVVLPMGIAVLWNIVLQTAVREDSVDCCAHRGVQGLFDNEFPPNAARQTKRIVNLDAAISLVRLDDIH